MYSSQEYCQSLGPPEGGSFRRYIKNSSKLFIGLSFDPASPWAYPLIIKWLRMSTPGTAMFIPNKRFSYSPKARPAIIP